MHKYGIENFSFEVLEKTKNYDQREDELIKYYNTKTPNGYNILDGGSNFVAFGEDNPRNTISDKTVLLIINTLKENKLSDREIAKKYNTTDNIVSDINHGLTHIIFGEKYPIRVKRGKQKLTEIEVNEIKEILENTLTSYQEIADLYNVSKGTIYHINKGLTFKENREYPIRKAHRVN
jgi:predicted DNA-binding protein YlxM (UPF0122 family)